MPEKLMKITYQGPPPAKKLNAYLRMPSQTYAVLRREIDMYLFQERQLPKAEIKTFWIDADNDEIEIVNQNDYEIFFGQCGVSMHLQIAAIEEEVEPKPASAPDTSDDPSNFIIHDKVECDICGLSPLVGFRYKCIQCPNFDLCQGCEASHKHPEHMMVRMPTNDGPSVVEAWLSGPGHSGRRSGRRHQRAQCPFAQGTTPPTATGGEFTANKNNRRERGRRHGGVLSQFLEMMTNLPESNTPVTTPTTSAAAAAPTAAAKKEESTPSAPSAEPTVTPETATKVASGVQETPKTAEPVAAPRSKDAPEPSTAQTETPPAAGGAATTPTTPVINLENLSQIVPPEYMRAGIEILNNFSEMFAKMIDPSEAASFDAFEPSSAASATASQAAEAATDAATAAAKAAAAAVNAATAAANATSAATAAVATTLPTPPTGTPESVSLSSESSTSTESSLANAPLLTTASPVAAQKPKEEETERRRSESLEHDWQMIDNNGSPANTEALINLDTSAGANPTPAAASAAALNFGQLGEILRQHITDEQQREQATAHTQTSQVATVTTSTSTNSVSTSSTGTSPAPPEEKRSVPIYHTDERINSAIHAMMAMGFSNEGAWLTQLLESVQGNIPAALDIMHTSQRSSN
ncbi:uncharacterized protein Dwil_GK24381 [Drosophila willistoni]|uniref:Protein ref(2)P n=1 Tax=Drosophila willistoni TaxID=7260 RepID=B4MZG8_DROWI|nr:protein ref(2)P [Drosophila willistoni]EDW77753.2 uncharacterized protein Dwil_GK24381 [Drosophila willistoni]